MGLETATWITDLQAANPGSTDLRSQGDDHIRLIKTVLQDNFPTASKAWYNPTTQAKSADFTVVASDMNKTFLIDTTGGLVNLTLPTLVAGDAGWECFFIKTTLGVNPVIVKPASGSVSSGNATVTAARRAIPNIRIQCLWTGTAWVISRAVSVPVGSVLHFHFSTLPNGYEWPNGQVLGSPATNYQEYYVLNGNSGATLDKRGRVDITLDNLGGSSAGRLSGGIITGTTVGNTGGSDVVTLGLSQIPAGITSSGTLPFSLTSGVVTAPVGFSVYSAQPGSQVFSATSSGGFVGNNNASCTGTVTSNNTSGLSHSNLQPSMMTAQVLVVE